MVLSVAALGAITGSLTAPWITRHLGAQRCLYLSISGWVLGYGTIGLSQNSLVMALALFAVMACAMLWNVITVSWRQRRIPTALLGRVNSIYRCFGWGSMPLGALAGGAIVALLDGPLPRDLALRAPFLIAASLCLLLLLYALKRLRLT
jgi:MFS family permease